MEGKDRIEDPSAPESISISCWACRTAEWLSWSAAACSRTVRGECGFGELVLGGSGVSFQCGMGL